MKIVKKSELIRIIKAQYTYYTEREISDIISEYGAQYFNGRGCEYNFKYIGFGEWVITNAE